MSKTPSLTLGQPKPVDPAKLALSNRLAVQILTLEHRRDKMPAACRGPIDREIEAISRRRANLNVGGLR